MTPFAGCYLLHSKHPQSRGRSYIGFTVNPKRRIKQHNGVICNGAWKTSKWRPWEMALVVYGFTTQVQALQFEWAWQHPTKSKAVRGVAAELGSRKMSGLKGKIALLQSMLAVPPWCFFPLTLQYLSTAYADLGARTTVPHPAHLRVVVAPLEDLPDPGAEGMAAAEDEDEAIAACDGGGGPTDGSGSEADAAEAGLPTQEAPIAEEEGWLAARVQGAGQRGISGLQVADVEQEGSSGLNSAGGGGGGGGGNHGTAEWEGMEDGAEVLGSQQAGADGEAGECSQQASAKPAKNRCVQCDLCEKAIERNVMRCGACSRSFHLECLASDWNMQATFDPLTGDVAPSQPGLAPVSQGSGAMVPERGRCPACFHECSWLELLSTMLPFGKEHKPRQRAPRTKRAMKSTKTRSGEDAHASQQQQSAPLTSAANIDNDHTAHQDPQNPPAAPKKGAWWC